MAKKRRNFKEISGIGMSPQMLRKIGGSLPLLIIIYIFHKLLLLSYENDSPQRETYVVCVLAIIFFNCKDFVCFLKRLCIIFYSSCIIVCERNMMKKSSRRKVEDDE